jgi:hypothetical protein
MGSQWKNSPVVFEEKPIERKRDVFDIDMDSVALLGIDQIKNLFKMMIVRELMVYINGQRKLDVGFFKVYDRAMEILEKDEDGETDMGKVCATAKEMFGSTVK